MADANEPWSSRIVEDIAQPLSKALQNGHGVLDWFKKGLVDAFHVMLGCCVILVLSPVDPQLGCIHIRGDREMARVDS